MFPIALTPTRIALLLLVALIVVAVLVGLGAEPVPAGFRYMP
jgi:hypothetical protein